jgi:aminoglycoside phosphotransferase (APT) family kinase protein
MQGEQTGECEESAKVVRAVGAALGVHARVEGRLPLGNVNRIYKVSAEGRAYAVKVFKHPDWPEAGKLPWVESQLSFHKVPHAELIHYTREGSHFAHGFSVSEFVEGDNCKAAMREGRLTPAAYCELAGVLLRRVHEISVPLYGYIGDGAGMFEDFVGWLLGCEVGDSLREIKDGPEPWETLYTLIERKAEPALRRYESRFRPALVHVDCTPKNGILCGVEHDGGARLVLVDWDEAAAGFWAKDYAKLTYWYTHMYRNGALAAAADDIRDAFLRGYGETGFDRRELSEIESALHLSEAAGELSYFYRVGDAEGFTRTREFLLYMLDAPG